MKREVIIPSALQKGDTVVILAPAGIVRNEYVEKAAEMIRAKGFKVRVNESVLTDGSGSYSAPAQQRLAEFAEAWGDDNVKCIICGRGGYGAIHLLGELDREFIASHPKWLIGFSDISALHALLDKCSIVSVHGPMCKHLSNHEDDAATRKLFSILTGGKDLSVSAPANRFNQEGEAEGKLIGGNLAVLNSLACTPFDMLSDALTEDCIMFLEDVSEAIYAVERMMWRLHLSGVLRKLKGLIIGRFTEYKPDRNYPDMETMIQSHIKEWGIDGIPVAFDFPIGHIECNIPVLTGARARLEVGSNGSILTYPEMA